MNEVSRTFRRLARTVLLVLVVAAVVEAVAHEGLVDAGEEDHAARPVAEHVTRSAHTCNE